MEFADPRGPVTLLHFTPLPKDDFAPQSYGRCLETSTAVTGCSPASAAEGHVSALSASLDTSSAPMSCSLPYNYVGSNSCEVYNSLAMEQTPAYCGQQEQMQTSQPIPALPTMAQEYTDQEFRVLLNSSPDVSCDVGPPPVRLPRLEPPVPVSVDTTFSDTSSFSTNLSPGSSTYYGEQPHCHSSPHSPMSMGADSSLRKSMGVNKNKVLLPGQVDAARHVPRVPGSVDAPLQPLAATVRLKYHFKPVSRSAEHLLLPAVHKLRSERLQRP